MRVGEKIYIDRFSDDDEHTKPNHRSERNDMNSVKIPEEELPSVQVVVETAELEAELIVVSSGGGSLSSALTPVKYRLRHEKTGADMCPHCTQRPCLVQPPQPRRVD
ncbi:unnamed protein product [Calicophoron daubneyi]|uniref:Uncharacterized protein n=1 Tax=Calicophoron daubneyi TaxID=300641 RepID=A0AAV2SZ30_CALDB